MASQIWPGAHTAISTAPHLVHKHGGSPGGLRQLGARPRVPAEHKLPASIPLHHNGKGVGAVHHRDRPQGSQLQLLLHSRKPAGGHRWLVRLRTLSVMAGQKV